MAAKLFNNKEVVNEKFTHPNKHTSFVLNFQKKMKIETAYLDGL